MAFEFWDEDFPDDRETYDSSEIKKFPSVSELRHGIENALANSFLESYFHKPKAPVVIKSHDTELKNQSVDQEFIPDILQEIPEKKYIWNLIQEPLVNKDDILQRQNIFEAFLLREELPRLLALKNQSYQIYNGLQALFAPTPVDNHGDHKEPLLSLYKSGRSDLAHRVNQALSSIEVGTKALSNLQTSLTSFVLPDIQRISQDILRKIESINHLNFNYLIEFNYSMEEVLNSASSVHRTCIQLGVLLETSQMISKNNLQKTSFHEHEAAKYENGWYFLQPVNKQVKNSSPQDLPLIIYSGANTSGKSQSGLKQNYYLQMLAQSIGFVPTDPGANFHIYDSFGYLDRASTDHGNNLSAFGSEIHDWKEALKQMQEKPFLCIDEGFSTTSPEDQFKLLYAASINIRERKGKIFLATHNEKFIIKLEDDPLTAIYHFQVEFLQNGGLACKYILESGAGDSEALKVARNMSVLSDIINSAELYLTGNRTTEVMRKSQIFHILQRYTVVEREEMKKLANSLGSMGDTHGSMGSLLSAYTQDESFTGNYFYTGEDTWRNKIQFGDWKYYTARIRQHLIKHIIQSSEPLDSKILFERQEMFEGLSQRGEYQKFKELSEKIIWICQVLPRIQNATSSLLDFNNVIGFDLKEMTTSELISYLEFQKKVLKERFDYDHELGVIKQLHRMCDSYQELYRSMDIQDIHLIARNYLERPIEDEKIKILFKQYVVNEPEAEKWNGIISIARISAYIADLFNNDYKTYWEFIGHSSPSKILASYYKSFNLATTHEHTLFHELAELVSLENREVISYDTVKNLVKMVKNYLKEKSVRGEEVDQEIQEKSSRLSNILDSWYGFLEGLPLDSKDLNIINSLGILEKIADSNEIAALEAISFRNVEDYIHRAYIKKFSRSQESKFASVPIFDIDLESVETELKVLIELHKTRYKDTSLEQVDWPKSLIIALHAEMYLDKRNYFQELIDGLRNYDSVALHQSAHYTENLLLHFNSFRNRYYLHGFESDLKQVQKNLKEAMRFFENHKKELKILCGKKNVAIIEQNLLAGDAGKLIDTIRKNTISQPRDIVTIMENVYKKHIKKMYEDFLILEKKWRNLLSKYNLKEQNDIGSVYDILCNYENIDKHKSARSIVDTLDSFLKKRKISLNSDSYYKESNQAESSEKKLEIFRSFYREKVIESGLILELETIREYDQALRQESINLVKKYEMDLSDGDRNQNVVLKDIKKGDYNVLHILSRYIQKEFSKKANKVLNIPYVDRGSPTDQMQAEMDKIGSVFLLGDIIRRNNMAKVEFNENGNITLDNMFYIQDRKLGQVVNSVSFDSTNPIRLYTGPNMSGKTFHKKSLVYALSTALSTGYAPASYATLPILDSVIYIDRVMEKKERDASAFANEIIHWNKLLKQIQEGKLVFASVDEAFSSTSPKYQSALTYAVVLHLLNKGQYMTISSHNHDVLEALEGLKGVTPFHFSYSFDAEGKISFTHQIQVGHRLSEAIAVAKKLGFNEAILKIAEAL